MPSDITKFSDIKLRQYNNLKGCQDATPTLKGKYTVSKNDKLFKDYAENTQDMIQTAAKNQSKLLDVVNELFTYVIDPYTGKQKIRVNPKLTEESLQKSVEKTRKLIIQLYVDCELSYVKGIKLYEAIVESKILETTQNQIKILTTQADKIIKETTAVVKPKAPVAVPLNTSYNPAQVPLNAAPTPLNAAPTPLNAAPTPLNAAPTPLNANFVPTITKPLLPPAAVENDNFIPPLPDKTYNEKMNIQDIPSSEETNLYNENKDAQIIPQQNNFNAPKPVN
jgi:hypothetical protein